MWAGRAPHKQGLLQGMQLAVTTLGVLPMLILPPARATTIPTPLPTIPPRPLTDGVVRLVRESQ